VEFHQPSPSVSFIPLYLGSGESARLIARVEADTVHVTYPHARIVRNRRGHATRAYLLAEASVAASHIGAYSGGNSYRQHLPSGHTCWAMRPARRQGNHADHP